MDITSCDKKEGPAMATNASITNQRAHWAQALRHLADNLDTSSDNHLASTLPFEIGSLARGLAELYAAVEAQRSVAFAMRSPEERGI